MFRAPKGTHDVLPPESEQWLTVIGAFAAATGRAGYGLLQSPMFEDYQVFSRVGESTDVVRKEMYDFVDKGDHHVALRPEGTASVVRAFVEHSPATPWKVWYAAPSFRYERPQAGRYRQHHQLGVEVLGTADPDVDVEVIALQADFYADLGISQTSLRLNSLGDDVCRPGYRAALLQFLEARKTDLCPEHAEADLSGNPLRVLDCKKPACVAATADAPEPVHHLCDECGAHLERVEGGLKALGIAYERTPRLVRGLDYYTRTTFEFAALALEGAQNGIGGGGRYDGLVEALGGRPTPGIGFGTGIERIVLAALAEGADLGHDGPRLDAFVVDTTGGQAARDLCADLRRAGLGADRAFDGRSMKSQMKHADRSGARVAVIVGSDELAAGTVTVRPLRGEGAQTSVATGDLVAHLRNLGGFGA